MSLKIENSRRVAESRPVCLGLNYCIEKTSHVILKKKTASVILKEKNDECNGKKKRRVFTVMALLGHRI